MFRVRVLGGFALDGPAGALPPPLRRRAGALLAVLAVCGDVGCTRDRVAALFWPESDEAHSRQGLRDALYVLRRTLGPGAIPRSGPLLRLDPAVVASDVQSFTRALSGGRYAEAVLAYSGPLLDGLHVDEAREFARWLDAERSRLAREYVEALQHLATAAERGGAMEEAAGWWARAVEHDPLSSRLALQHLRALVAIGDRAAALRVAEAHARRLQQEFGLEPEPELLATVARIRQGEPPARNRGTPARPSDAPVDRTPSLGEVTGPAPSPDGPDADPASHRRPAWTSVPRPRRLPWSPGVASLVLLASALGVADSSIPDADAPPSPRTTIAVLPLQNLSADPARAYFAAGLHDELVSELSRVSALHVVGRSSVSAYEARPKPLNKIGEELAAGSIVEGSVQVEGDRLRVIVHLLDPATEADLWTDEFDRTLDDAFAVQSEIAHRIVAGIGATLTNADAAALASSRTGSPEAYEFYLQGLEYWRRPGILRQNLEIAERLYERALVLDGTLAPAHAALSRVHWALYELRYDRSAPRLKAAQREADIALRLAPDLPEAHLATGLALHLAHGDSHRAVHEIELALHGAPNDPDLWAWMGRLERHLGHWDSAVVALDRAARGDPRNADLFVTLGNTFHYLHRYDAAIEAYRHAVALAPDLLEPRLAIGWSYILWKGEMDTLAAVLRTAPPDSDPGGGGECVAAQRMALLLWERRADSLLALVKATPTGTGLDCDADRALMPARAQLLLGDTGTARFAFDSAAALLSTWEREHPDDATLHAGLGLALAGLGRRAEALREVRWLEALERSREDPYESALAQDRARILARAGATDAALTEIERLLARPSLLSVQELRLSPEYDGLRADPRFQAIVARYTHRAL